MKILITGGHYTPAMAVIDHLKNHEVVFVGRKYSIESELTESPEFKEINTFLENNDMTLLDNPGLIVCSCVNTGILFSQPCMAIGTAK